MKRLITFEVDDGVLFDAVRKMGGDLSSVGTRVVETLLMGDSGFLTAVGMAVYGIVMVRSEPAPSSDQPGHPATEAEGGRS